jgi:integrase/recombinase XerD
MSLTPLSGFLTPVSRQPFARRSSVDVFVRHTQGCPHRPSGRDFRKCRCPKYLYIYKDGQPSRLSAKTASWPEAEKKAQEVRNSWIPELAELKRLRAEKEMGRIGIEEAVDLYIADMRTRNQAKLTVANARSLFKSQQNSLSLISWVSKYNSDKEEMLRLMWLDQLDGTVLSRWRSEWVGAPLTLRNRWSRVVSFFNWFFRTGKIQKHPCVGLRNFSAHEGTTTPFTGVQFEHLLASIDKLPQPENVDRQTRDGWRPRIRALILVMRWLGLAIADAASLKRSELVYDDDTGFWCVDTDRQKTGSPVYVPLPHDMYEELMKVPPERGSHPEYFFLNPYNDINSETARWQRRLRDLFKIADLKDELGRPIRCHSHKFRNTFAAFALASGVPLDHVSKALGHDSIKTTEKSYAKWIRDRQILVVNSLAGSWSRQRKLVSIESARREKLEARLSSAR